MFGAKMWPTSPARGENLATPEEKWATLQRVLTIVAQTDKCHMISLLNLT